MIRSFPSSYQPTARSARNSMQTTKGVADFLRVHDKMASLLPAVTRMAALQKDCAALLPTIFESSAVVQYESNQLVLSVANSALAAKLKQQLPKLQDGLVKRGWQVSSIRLKLQPGNIYQKVTPVKQLDLPVKAFSALAALNTTLEDSPRNEALKAAITRMLNRHRRAR
jgi:hypothetical protein